MLAVIQAETSTESASIDPALYQLEPIESMWTRGRGICDSSSASSSPECYSFAGGSETLQCSKCVCVCVRDVNFRLSLYTLLFALGSKNMMSQHSQV